MTLDPADRKLTREQLDAAIAVLREERAAHPVSARQGRHFRWFQWSVWTLLGGFALTISVVSFLVDSKSPSEPSLPALMLFLAGSLLSILGLLSALVLFALNLKLFARTVREMAIAVRSRLWRLTSPGAGRPTWLRRLLWIPKAYGLLLVVAVLVGMAMALWEAWHESPPMALFGLAVVVVVAAHFFFRFARRRLALLDDADRIATSLAALAAGSATVAVPDAVFRKVARIEDSQIERKRAEALAGPEHRATDYAVLRSRRLVQQLQEAEPMLRLRIERCIADLADTETLEPVPGVETIAVPQTGCDLRFRRDAATHQIEVLELRAAGPDEEVAHA